MPDAGNDPYALTTEERAINRAAWRAEIQRGASLYFIALRAYDIPQLINALNGIARNDVPQGATQSAWQAVVGRGLPVVRFFAYGDLLEVTPRLVGYYRRLVGASTKAVRNAYADPQPYETGVRAPMDHARANGFAELFNRAISPLLEAAPGLTVADADALVCSTAGAQIQGEIVTRKGALAQEEVWRWIAEYTSTNGYLAHVESRGTNLPQLDVGDAGSVGAVSHQLRALVLTNGIVIRYSNEPDIEFRNDGNRLLAVHEIKAGIDFAAAKERYPAASRSFKAAKDENPACHTVLVAGCLSAAVKRLIATEGWVDRDYLLPSLQLTVAARDNYLEQEIRPYAER